MPRGSLTTRTLGHRALLGALLLGLAIGACNPSPAASRLDEVQQATTISAWAPNKSYSTGTLVTHLGITYQARQTHTSVAGQPPPTVLALWMRPTPTGVTAWAVQTNYVVTSTVTFGGRLYECFSAHVSQSDWAPDKAPTLWRCAGGCCAGSGCTAPPPQAPPIPVEDEVLRRGAVPELADTVTFEPVDLPLTKEDMGIPIAIKSAKQPASAGTFQGSP